MVSLRGELDIAVEAALERQLAQLILRKPDQVIFDVTEVTFIDCGIARLLAGIGQRRPSARKPLLRSACPWVRRLLELSELDTQC